MKPERRREAFFVLRMMGEVLEARPRHAGALARAAEWLTALGHYGAGLALDRRLAALRPRDPEIRYNLACSLALASPRQPDAALDELERAVELGYGDLGHMAGDADLAALRPHPRYAALVRRMRGPAPKPPGRKRAEGGSAPQPGPD